MTQQKKKHRSDTKMVPVPSHSIIPERDVNEIPVMETRHLGIEFGGLKAVDDFNLTIGKTEIAGLIGPNGAGKTTVFNLLTKVYEPTSGAVLINGQDLHGMSIVQASRLGIARTFQNIRLFDKMTVEENVRIGLHNQIKYDMFTGILRLPRYWKQEKHQHQRAMELLDIFGMQDLADETAGSLPYGAQRRLEIARALATEPKMLLLDEPAAGMNPQESLDLMHFIDHIREEFNLTILLIEHDMKVVMGVCDRLWVMEYGALIAEGTPEEIRANPLVIKAYLGEDMVL